MSRTLSTNVNNEVTPDSNGEVNVRLAHLLNIQTSTPIYVTNHTKNLTYDSQSYTAGGSFVAITEVEETGDLSYQNLSVSLNNVTTTVRDTFKNIDFVNASAKVYVAFLDANETIIDAYEYFNGSVSSASLVEQEGQFAINLELANQWRNWDIIKGRKFTSTSQEKKFPNDVGLEFASETNSNVRWNR